MYEGMTGYAESATAGLNSGYSGRTNPDYGADLPSPTEGRYLKLEDEKSIGFIPRDGKNTRLYKFHKKSGVGVVVVKEPDGLITVKFIG